MVEQGKEKIAEAATKEVLQEVTKKHFRDLNERYKLLKSKSRFGFRVRRFLKDHPDFTPDPNFK